MDHINVSIRVTLHPDTVLSRRYPVAYVSAITPWLSAISLSADVASLPSPYLGLRYQAGKYMKHAGLVRDILRRRLSAILKGVTFTPADNLENYFYRSLFAPIVDRCHYLVFKTSLQMRNNEISRLDVYTNIYYILFKSNLIQSKFLL